MSRALHDVQFCAVSNRYMKYCVLFLVTTLNQTRVRSCMVQRAWEQSFFGFVNARVKSWIMCRALHCVQLYAVPIRIHLHDWCYKLEFVSMVCVVYRVQLQEREEENRKHCTPTLSVRRPLTHNASSLKILWAVKKNTSVKCVFRVCKNYFDMKAEGFYVSRIVLQLRICGVFGCSGFQRQFNLSKHNTLLGTWTVKEQL